MEENKDIVPYAVTAGCGLIVYVVITAATGLNEAWDGSAYYAIGIPIMCVVAFRMGYQHPSRPWRWAASMAAGQMVGALLNGSSLNLLPFALIFMAIISIPQFLAASLGSKIARKRAAE